MNNIDNIIKYRLADNMEIYCLAGSERDAAYVYKEIFIDNSYLKHSIEINDNDTILDIGANIGLFTLFAASGNNNLKIYSCEPVSPVYKVLSKNIEDFNRNENNNIKLLNLGISDENTLKEIEFLPVSPANSTVYPEHKRQDFNLLAKSIPLSVIRKENFLHFLLLLIFYPFKALINRRIYNTIFHNSKKIQCKFITLSKMIEEHNISKVDLLKIDVEGSEIDIINGIKDIHWDLIRQIVIELSPSTRNRLDFVIELLKSKGFANIEIENMFDDNTKNTENFACMIFAQKNKSK